MLRPLYISEFARAMPRDIPGATTTMPIDKTLKIRSGATKDRNVLTRAERIEKLKELEKFQPGTSVLGLPKVRVVKLALKKKKKAKAEEGAEGDKAVTPAAGGAKPAAGAKPAGGAKK